MKEGEDLPRPDQIEGAAHPAETLRLFGHQQAEAQFLESVAAGRLHHAWRLTGPRGIGKATLAWRIARFLLRENAGDELFGPPTSLDVPQDDPVARRMRAGAESRLFVLRRAYDEKAKRLKTVITVDEVRRLKSFFSLSAADGGHRVVIVDAADEMNTAAANALLKQLEEPPAATTLLLVNHQPSALLPTLRSRCRELRLSPLDSGAMSAALTEAGLDPGEETPALTALSAGSVGAAIRLVNLGGIARYADLVRLLESLPGLDRPRAMKLADSVAGAQNVERLDLLIELLDLLLSRLSRTGATGAPPSPEAAPGEGAVFTRLCPNPHSARVWATLAQDVGGRLRHGRAVNLDPAALMLDTIFKLQRTASEDATGAA
ncbi:DNA polymerase III, delta prime subunit [Poseidonocella pacifica]|uniref:DNA polymerase III, delta prime subunit n=1 Tax=Poseidonocella pacifica TaxID=871651 RepID=A0A1I0YSH7_9RHOB|nr:DNA polymerase III subunit delta' [Poseidonocella pacifica]SFB15776.1 DNA polymerase III, delta prime subunit [Poseidonocella pacifica]